jgi:hypothetical protein
MKPFSRVEGRYQDSKYPYNFISELGNVKKNVYFFDTFCNEYRL